MPTIEEVRDWQGQTAYGPGNDKLGKIEDIYLDDQTGEPEWAAIKTGLFGGAASFAPLAEARREGDGIQFPYDKDKVKDAPSVDADGQLSQEEESRLYQHYGLNYSEAPSDSGLPTGRDRGTTGTTGTTGGTDRGTTGRGVVGNDVSGPETDEAMTRSEEELRVGTTQRETGRARLRKYIVTENVEKTVPVTREEVRVEREPITDANRDQAYSGKDLSEEEHEVTLHAEEPVVQKDVVAKERVRMDKDTVTEEKHVSEEVRKEQIEADGDGVTDRDRR